MISGDMKQSTSYAMQSIACLCILYLCWLILSKRIAEKYNIQISEPEIKIGQVWVGVDSLDPFKPVEYDTIEVIDIKGKYSKIIWNGDTTSMKTDNISWRRTLNTCIRASR